jgi:hypothetical protein
MVLRGATSLLGALEGVGPENLDFFDVTIAHPSPPHAHPSIDAYTIVGGGGGGLPTTPHPLNTSSHKTAARRPPQPSYTQQHYTTALGYINS